MYTLQVYPLATGLPQKYFTYFSSLAIQPGSLVEIKIKNRSLLGLVARSTALLQDKINIKSQSFPLRKIERLVLANFFSSQLLEALLKTEILFQMPLSASLETYLPKFIFTDLPKLNFKSETKDLPDQILSPVNFLPKIILGNTEERISEYRKIITENFKNSRSLTIFAPTILASELLREKLAEYEPILFHSDLKESLLQENLEKLKTPGPKLIISTPSLLPFLLREQLNLETVILDQENSSNYISQFKKHALDFRELVKILARDLELELYLAGALISVNNFLETKIISQAKTKTNLRLLDLAKEKSPELTAEELQTRTKKISENTYKEYSPIYFSRVLAQKLDQLKNSSGHAFLFTKRKGLATETICEDCNQILKCSNCETPYILYEKGAERYYLCPHCQKKISLTTEENVTCENCDSWRLKTLGVGSEGLVKELQSLGFETFLIDKEHTKTRKKILETLNKWQASETGILVGTELAVNFLRSTDQVDLAAVISLDSLFAIPDYQMDERIFSLILNLSEKANSSNPLLIQTRLGEQDLWKFILTDERVKFLETELATRKTLSLPPYTQILKFKLYFREAPLKPHIAKALTQIFQEEKLTPPKLTWQYDPKTKQHLGTIILDKNLLQLERAGKLLPTALAERLSEFF